MSTVISQPVLPVPVSISAEFPDSGPIEVITLLDREVLLSNIKTSEGQARSSGLPCSPWETFRKELTPVVEKLESGGMESQELARVLSNRAAAFEALIGRIPEESGALEDGLRRDLEQSHRGLVIALTRASDLLNPYTVVQQLATDDVSQRAWGLNPVCFTLRVPSTNPQPSFAYAGRYGNVEVSGIFSAFSSNTTQTYDGRTLHVTRTKAGEAFEYQIFSYKSFEGDISVMRPSEATIRFSSAGMVAEPHFSIPEAPGIHTLKPKFENTSAGPEPAQRDLTAWADFRARVRDFSEALSTLRPAGFAGLQEEVGEQLETIERSLTSGVFHDTELEDARSDMQALLDHGSLLIKNPLAVTEERTYQPGFNAVCHRFAVKTSLGEPLFSYEGFLRGVRLASSEPVGVGASGIPDSLEAGQAESEGLSEPRPLDSNECLWVAKSPAGNESISYVLYSSRDFAGEITVFVEGVTPVRLISQGGIKFDIPEPIRVPELSY